MANGDTYRINATTMYPIDGSWMHVAGTYDGSTMRLYINGVLESSMVVPGGIPAAVNTLPLTIGAQDGTSASRWFMGWMDDVRVYNRALSLSEIQALVGGSGSALLTVDKSGTGSGTVTSAPAGLDCGSTCAVNFPLNASVVLSAASAPGSTFTGWSGGSCSGTDTCTVTMDADKTVTATFTQDEYSLTLDKVGSGTVTAIPNNAHYHFGDVVTLTADPDLGWSFAGWSANVVGGDVTINGDTTVTATFAQDEYSLTLDKVGSGTITATPNNAHYHYSDVVALSAEPDLGWSFGGWSVNVVAESITITANTIVTATFIPYEYSLSIDSPHGNVIRDPEKDTYHYGDEVTLGVSADTGWIFTGWTPALIDNKVTILGNTTLTANFAASPSLVYVRPGGENILCNGTENADYSISIAPACSVKTIQRGIDIVSTGGTVNVAAGTYPERLVVNKPLSLIGAGAPLSVIDGTSFLTVGNVIDITALTGSTRIQGFDILTGDMATGIHSAGGTDAGGRIEILGNRIISTCNPDESVTQFGIIAGYMDLRTLLISGNVISNTYSNSILVELQMGATEITWNTLDGCFPSIWFMTYDGHDVSPLQKIGGNTIDMSTADAGSGASGISLNPSTSYVEDFPQDWKIRKCGDLQQRDHRTAGCQFEGHQRGRGQPGWDIGRGHQLADLRQHGHRYRREGHPAVRPYHRRVYP